jgi:hypothetical protein
MDSEEAHGVGDYPGQYRGMWNITENLATEKSIFFNVKNVLQRKY